MLNDSTTTEAALVVVRVRCVHDEGIDKIVEMLVVDVVVVDGILEYEDLAIAIWCATVLGLGLGLILLFFIEVIFAVSQVELNSETKCVYVLLGVEKSAFVKIY